MKNLRKETSMQKTVSANAFRREHVPGIIRRAVWLERRIEGTGRGLERE